MKQHEASVISGPGRLARGGSPRYGKCHGGHTSRSQIQPSKGVYLTYPPAAWIAALHFTTHLLRSTRMPCSSSPSASSPLSSGPNVMLHPYRYTRTRRSHVLFFYRIQSLSSCRLPPILFTLSLTQYLRLQPTLLLITSRRPVDRLGVTVSWVRREAERPPYVSPSTVISKETHHIHPPPVHVVC